MPFGSRQLDRDVSGHDFDRVYRDLIVPAAQSAGWEVLRIDELPAAGSINDQYLRELYSADLVLADIGM
jgi:hypothetical protein